LTEEWAVYERDFALFRTIDSVALDPTEVYAIHFSVDPQGPPVDIMIDDLSFN
jgi:hypothetical protein